MRQTLLMVEGFCFVGALVAAVLWICNPAGRWEPICTAFALVGSVATDLIRRVLDRTRRGRFESERARTQHREALRKELKDEIMRCRAEQLRQDVIIRHVDRVDAYPDVDEHAKGISPWFRVWLVDTYKRGVILCLRSGGLVRCDSGYRYVDYVNDEKADVSAWLMGDVPYDSIATVNLDGDEYYPYPHIYCHFDYHGEPYERKWFCQKIDQPHGHPYFKKLAEYKEVDANNPNTGTLHFG